MKKFMLFFLVGTGMATCARAALTTEIYRINSGGYIEIGGFAGVLTNPLPNSVQTFLEFKFDYDQGTARMRILGEDFRTEFWRFDAGRLEGGQVVFSNLTWHPWHPLVTNVAVLNYTVQLGDASVWMNGSLTSKVPCCDIPHSFLHQDVHATVLPGPPPDPVGVYEYQGYDPAGSLIVTGRLLITSSHSPIEGSWRLAGVHDPAGIGPQIGEGPLRGTFDGSALLLDLNPGYADNNVFLSGTLADGSYTGGWAYSTLLGMVTNGTFVAVKTLFHLRTPAVQGDGFGFTLQLDEGMLGIVEYADSLSAVDWSELTRVQGTGAATRAEDPHPPGSMRFYRIRILLSDPGH